MFQSIFNEGYRYQYLSSQHITANVWIILFCCQHGKQKLIHLLVTLLLLLVHKPQLAEQDKVYLLPNQLVHRFICYWVLFGEAHLPISAIEVLAK